MFLLGIWLLSLENKDLYISLTLVLLVVKKPQSGKQVNKNDIMSPVEGRLTNE